MVATVRLYPGYEKWSELDLLTGVIIGEARGENHEGRVGVGIVVRNRVASPGWWGRNWREVILCRHQFSCWADHNAAEIHDERRNQTALWAQVREIAADVYLGHIVDRLGGPTHYHAVGVSPSWAVGMINLGRIGGHVFYR